MRSESAIGRFLVFSALVLVTLMAVVRIGDYDIWYHLKFGEYVLNTGSINHPDPFSYTTPGLPWPVHSWLAAVIYFKLYSIAGAPGLIIVNALLTGAAFLLVFLTMRLFMEDEGEAFLAAALLIVAAFAMRFRMWVRPHVFEFVFLTASVYILNLYRARGRNLLFIIPVLQALWVNTHGSQILGLIVPAIFLAGGAVQFFILREMGRHVPAKRYLINIALVITGNILATLINPDFYMALISPFTILAPFMQSINEFQPLQWHHLWGYELRYTWGFAALLVLGAAGFMARIKKTDITDVLLFAAFLLMAIRGIRFMAEFALISAPIISRGLSGPVYRVIRGVERPAIGAMVFIVIFVAAPFAFSGRTYKFGLGVKENIFPEKAIDFIEKAGIRGNVFNSYGFGDYLIWRTFPERKVFIHGHSRSEFFPEKFYKAYLEAHTSAEAWKDITDRYNVSYTLLEYYRTDYGGKEAVPHLVENPEWTPVYWDTLAIVYVKDGPENRDLVERHGFKYIRPTNLDFTYLDRYIKNNMSGLPLADLDRLISISPDNEEAYLARAYIYFFLGKDTYGRAVDDIKKAISINPGQSMSHSALGILYMKLDDPKKAKAEFERTIELDPGNPAAVDGLKEIKAKGL